MFLSSLGQTLLGLAAAGMSMPQLAQTPVPLVTPVAPDFGTVSGTVIGLGEADENEWQLQTEQGLVTIDAGPADYQVIPLEIGEFITVTGEFDDGEFDAFRIRRADGTTLQVRPDFGPPPWADS